MKNFKKNAVVIAVLVFVCTAVYLNWRYAQETETIMDMGSETKTAAELTQREKTDDTGLYYTLTSVDTEDGGSAAEEAPEAEPSAVEEYFARVRLSRTRARDEAAAALSAIAESSVASQATVDEALMQMSQIAAWTLREADIENLIMSKGFSDCVVYITDESITVTTALEGGLSNASVAKITDVVLTETDFTADDLRVIEVKLEDSEVMADPLTES